MSVSSAIRAILLADGTVSGLVGTRIYPHLIPDGKSGPYIAYIRQDKNPHDGLSGNFGTAMYGYEISCWSDDYDEVQSLSAAAQSALVDYSGAISGTTIQHIWLDDAEDISLPSPANERLRRYGRAVDITVFTG